MRRRPQYADLAAQGPIIRTIFGSRNVVRVTAGSDVPRSREAVHVVLNYKGNDVQLEKVLMALM